MTPRQQTIFTSVLKSSSWKDHLDNWRLYATAAGASMAMATNADASTIYSGTLDLTVSIPPTGAHTAGQTFNIGGVIESMGVANVYGSGRRAGFASVHSVSTNHLTFARTSGFGAKKYAFGASIRVSGPVTCAPFFRVHDFFGTQEGSFGPGTVTGFVGFKNPTGDLGWLQIKVSDTNSDGYPDQLELIDWAYNNTPGGPITAGQTMDAPAAVPEPATISLGLLASGAAGLLGWRRRKAAIAATASGGC